MGPMQTESVGGARYVFIFIDDYSRRVWAYYLKGKDEVAQNTIAHIKLVVNQTGKSVKVIRSDNGTEYL